MAGGSVWKCIPTPRVEALATCMSLKPQRSTGQTHPGQFGDTSTKTHPLPSVRKSMKASRFVDLAVVPIAHTIPGGPTVLSEHRTSHSYCSSS